MIKRRSLLAGFAALAISGIVAGCSNGSSGRDLPADETDAFGFKKEGLPIVEKTLPLVFSGTKSALAPDYESMELVQRWKADTNIDITWDNLPDNVYAERKNLMLASGDLPDALFNTGLSDSEVVTNGANGTLIPLEALIDEYAPNLKGILDERPDIRGAITASDGHIYTLPAVEELGILAYPNFLFVNKTWLDEAGLPVPTTIDEYEDALRAFKARGGGVLPLSFRVDSFCANVADLIAAIGGLPDNNDHRIVQDDEVIFTATRDEWRTAVRRLGEWYQEGLIDPESFSQDDPTYLAKGKADPMTLGSFIWWEMKEAVGEDRVADYVHVGVLKGFDGKQRASVSNYAEINRGAFAITRANKYPAATMRWADRLYDPVMSAETRWGPVGVTLEEKDGILVQIPAKAGESEGERRQKVSPMGPCITTREDFETVVAPEPRAKERQDMCREFYEPYRANDAYPPVMLSNEELQQINDAQTEINTLVGRKFATWIVDGTIDAEWDAYVAQLEQMGLSKVIEVYQTAYDRYKNA
ncbi:extracellular solute-binding protein [Tessaracoccus lubricantis]|uniref:Extracellular solute-binding protein n=1 Tax=Tessaracoccus lubricantis TaxID=545543 RepID=A0ABP9F101_9ACTN